MGELSRLSDSNTHTLRYLVRPVAPSSARLAALECLIPRFQVACGRVNSGCSDSTAAPGDSVDVSGEHAVALAPAKRVRASK
jgi:hypothetical protein